MTYTQIVPRVVPFNVIICMPKQWAVCMLLAFFFPFEEIFLLLKSKGEKLHTKIMQKKNIGRHACSRAKDHCTLLSGP